MRQVEYQKPDAEVSRAAVERDELVEQRIIEQEIENARLRNQTHQRPVITYADDLVTS